MWNLRLAVSAFVCLFVCLCVVRHFEDRQREVGSKSRHGTDTTFKQTKNHFPNRPQKISRCPGRPNARHFVAGQESKIQIWILALAQILAFGAPCRARLVLVNRYFLCIPRSILGERFQRMACNGLSNVFELIGFFLRDLYPHTNVKNAKNGTNIYYNFNRWYQYLIKTRL